MGLTLDAGALIALEKNDREAWAFLKEAVLRNEIVTIPATIVVQTYRGARSARTNQLMKGVVVEPLDEEMAKRIGLLLQESKTDDVVDANVVASAHVRGDVILTSDPKDLKKLANKTSRRPRVFEI